MCFCLPPLRWSCSVSVGLRFAFSLALSGSARLGLGVLVLVSSPSLFFCVPLLGSWLGIFHLIFIFISFPFPSSSSFSFHCPDLNFSPSFGRVCNGVCVWNI